MRDYAAVLYYTRTFPKPWLWIRHRCNKDVQRDTLVVKLTKRVFQMQFLWD